MPRLRFRNKRRQGPFGHQYCLVELLTFLGRLNRALGAGRHIKQPQPVNGSGGPIGARGNPLLRAVEDVAIASGKPQPAWAPANEVATCAIQKRGYRAVVSAQRDLIAKGQPADQRRLRRAGIAVNADARLYITFDINLNRNRPKVVGFGRTELSQKSSVACGRRYSMLTSSLTEP